MAQRQTLAIGVTALAALLAAASAVQAAPMKGLANNGTQRPYSVLLDEAPVPMSIFAHPVYLAGPLTVPTGDTYRPPSVAEPARGNANPKLLGHIVATGINSGHRTLYAIWDRLAVVYVPHVLWFDPITGQMHTPGPYHNARAYADVIAYGGGPPPGAPGGARRGGGGGAIALVGPAPPGDEGGPPPPLDVIPEPAAIVLLLFSGAGVLGHRPRR